MSTVSIESSIKRARKAVKSKIQCMMGARPQREVLMERRLYSSNQQNSPQRRVFEMFFARPARRTISFICPRQLQLQQVSAEVQNQAVESPTLGDRLFSLPVELQLNIVNLLFFFDLLNLRKTSREFRNLTIRHESHIVRHHIHMWVPKHIIKLYPPPTSTPPTLNYLTDLAYKQRVSTQLALALANQIVKEMMGSRQQRMMTKEANFYVVNQLRLGTSPLIFALFHFLETYRERKLEHLFEIDCNTVGVPPALLTPLSHEKNMALQSDILKHYPDDLLLQVHQMYHLLLHLLIRRLSPSKLPFGLPTFSRWNSQRPTNQAFAKVLVLGGIREVWELYKIKGYYNRRKALEKYLRGLDSGKKEYSTLHSTHAEGSSTTRASRSTARVLPGRGPSLDIPSKLARLDVDELMDVWTPAAEERLLSREIVGSLDEVGCCGHFVSQLLSSAAESDNEDDGDEVDSEDEDEDGDDSAGPVGQSVLGLHYTGGSAGGLDSTWDSEDLNADEGEQDGDDDDSFGDDEGAGGYSLN